MKPTKIRVSDACECAFHGFALDVQDNCVGMWDGNNDNNNDDDAYAQDAEATRTALMWAGWLGEDEDSDHAIDIEPEHLRAELAKWRKGVRWEDLVDEEPQP